MDGKPKTEAEKQSQQREAPQTQAKLDEGYAEGGTLGQLKASAEVSEASKSGIVTPDRVLGVASRIAEVSGAAKTAFSLKVTGAVLNPGGKFTVLGALAGGKIGGYFGGFVGAKIGFAIGWAGSPIGAVNGAIIGWKAGFVLGATAGSLAGASLGRYLDNYFSGN